MSDQVNKPDDDKEKTGCCLCCCKRKSKKEGDMVVGNQPGTEQVVIRQPQSNGHQRSFTYEDCSYIDEGNETFEEKKWNENGGASITINDVSGIRVEQKQ